jgi:hypothetical protein
MQSVLSVDFVRAVCASGFFSALDPVVRLLVGPRNASIAGSGTGSITLVTRVRSHARGAAGPSSRAIVRVSLSAA